MTQSTENSATKTPTISASLTRFAPLRIFGLGVLLLFATLFFVQLHQPPAIATQATFSPTISLPSITATPPTPPPPIVKSSVNLPTTPSIWPAQGAITSGFGARISPFGGGNEPHSGIDIAYSMGAPVVATADGEVVVSGTAGGYGNLVQINHGNGIATLYGHNSQLLVTAGQQVKKGQVIAYAGSTGRSTGPHVHYEVRVNGTPVDPMKYLVQY